LANLVQAITGAGWLAAALLPLALPLRAQFSHRVHLAQKIDCLACHAAAPASKAASDNLLPNADVCAGCHTGDRKLAAEPLIKSPRRLTVTKFNHQLHVRMGKAIAPAIVKAIDAKTYLSAPGDLRAVLADTRHTCTSCHRGLDKSDAVTLAAFPAMADCLVCHTEIDPPFSCAKCHDEKANLKPASHTPNWIDVHSSGKANLDKPSCAVCHGRTFTCLGCH
jgi:predicted CXXCH cytochrome family protein